jgi:hypothetical protein
MTEAEWLTCTDPKPMLDFLREKVSDRKLRLWGCACCDLIRDLFPDEVYAASLDVVSRYADGLATTSQLSAAHQWVVESYRDPQPISVEAIRDVVLEAVAAASSSYRGHLTYALWFNVALALEGNRLRQMHGPNAQSVLADWFDAISCYNHDTEFFLKWADIDPRPQIISLIECVFGNPFRPLSLDSSWFAWNDGTAVKVAQGVYDERAFDRLPVLADALEEAGCTNANILGHCRGAGPHVRGCWVIDLLLGKE